jgi:signal transduction histidine kinase
MPLRLSEVDLGELAQAAIALLSKAAGGGRLSLDPPSASIIAKCDADLIRRVITNLVANALKFTPASGRMRLTVASDGTDARVLVIDNGYGIAPEYHQKIFDKFGQVESRRQANSTGLGLAFCKLAVERHGGKIGVESTVGKGSTFWFTLPLSKT